MAIGKEIGKFSLKSVSTSYAEEGGSVQINCDGTATGYGTVLGTLETRARPGLPRARDCSPRQSRGIYVSRSKRLGRGRFAAPCAPLRGARNQPNFS